MQLKEFDILLDIKKHNKIEEFEVVQGDNLSNILNISLVNGLNPFDLTNTNVEIVFSKSDGTTVQQTDIAIMNEHQGKIQCILKTNTIASPGKVIAEVRVLEGETLLTSARFDFFVRKSLINDETVESSNEFGTLQQVLSDYNHAIERVNQIEKQVPEQVVTDLNEVSTRVGPLSSLITRIKTSIVNAINGLQTDLDEHKAESATSKEVHGLKIENGIWTPQFGGDSVVGTTIYTNQAGIYYRIGNLVYINVVLRMTSATGGSTYFAISGLPYISNLSSYKFYTNVSQNLDVSIGNIADVYAGKIYFRTLNGTTAVAYSSFDTQRDISLSGIYRIS